MIAPSSLEQSYEERYCLFLSLYATSSANSSSFCSLHLKVLAMWVRDVLAR